MAIADKQGNTEIFRSDVTDTITDTSYIIPTWDMTLTSKVTYARAEAGDVIGYKHSFMRLWCHIPLSVADRSCLIMNCRSLCGLFGLS